MFVLFYDEIKNVRCVTYFTVYKFYFENHTLPGKDLVCESNNCTKKVNSEFCSLVLLDSFERNSSDRESNRG